MSETALTAWLARRICDVMERAVAVAPADEAVAGLLARLVVANGATAIVVVDKAGHALGLVNAVDLLPHLNASASTAQGTLAADLADRRALLAADEPLVEAVARTRRDAREHAVVAGASGQPVGLLRLSTALAVGYGRCFSRSSGRLAPVLESWRSRRGPRRPRSRSPLRCSATGGAASAID